jgi:pyridoxal 5-phosphate dependent beta-lyase
VGAVTAARPSSAGVNSDPSDWETWATARLPTSVNHLDNAAAGRSSIATLDATSTHARREATEGAYVAAAGAASTLTALRETMATVLGVEADGVAFTESAESALDIALRVWPLAPDSMVAIAPSEWGPNLRAFALAGLRAHPVLVDSNGVIDVPALERLLRRDPPALVHVTQQASHRAVRQPVDAVAAVCRDVGVPLWVDAAQAVGHCATNAGADVVYATSRKWLTGPRGVGVLGVAERWIPSLRIEPKPLLGDVPLLRYVESDEAHVAGRIGLANAVGEYLAAGPELVAARLDEVGRMTRTALADLADWEVVDPIDAAGAISAIRPTAGQDVVAVRARLLRDHAIVTTVSGTVRAPIDMNEPWLRVSPHVDVTPPRIDALCAALEEASQ